MAKQTLRRFIIVLTICLQLILLPPVDAAFVTVQGIALRQPGLVSNRAVSSSVLTTAHGVQFFYLMNRKIDSLWSSLFGLISAEAKLNPRIFNLKYKAAYAMDVRTFHAMLFNMVHGRLSDATETDLRWLSLNGSLPFFDGLNGYFYNRLGLNSLLFFRNVANNTVTSQSSNSTIQNPSGGNGVGGGDGISLPPPTTLVPEPETYLLLASLLALVGMAVVRMRRTHWINGDGLE